MDLLELRTGNLIEVFGKHIPVCGFGIRYNDENQPEVECVFFKTSIISKIGEVNCASPDEAKPIELNSEIMKSIGFKKNAEHYTINMYGYEIKWTNMPQFSYPLTISHQGKDDFLHLHNVRYVHQLQNIFKYFTNQELNIDLCKVQKHSKIR